MAPRALRHHQRKNIFIFANQENLRIFLICFFHGKSCFLCRERSRGTGLRAFIKFFSAGYVLFCVPKENQKGRRCPQGMKAPVGLLSRRPVCAANAACSARQGLRYFRGAGCGSLRLLRALDGTRILQAAAPTAPPCFGHWPRSSPLQTKGYSPLVTPKQLGSIQKIQVAPLKDFLCCADFKAPQSLRDSSPQGSERQQMQLLATAPSREKANQE